jgi:starvation-inducible DNA-binding protein
LRESANRCDQQYHDAGTVDFLTGLLEDHQKRAWMVRVHLAAQARLFRSIIPTNGIGQ